MMLHLVVPGLLWPTESVRDAARGLRLPALGTLLGRGGSAARPAATFEQWLARAFGLSDAEPPYGALRLLADGIAPGEDVWLCADPVHLRFARDTLVVGGRDELDLSDDEARQLVAALNAHFGELGEFLMQRADHWALRLPRTPRITTHPLDLVRGRQVQAYLPQGEDARLWGRTLNEIQMLLHGHPVNAAREAAGRRSANSVWLWGGGVLPRTARAPAAAVFAANPVAQGLARLAGLEPQAPPPSLAAPGTAPSMLVALEDLSAPAQNRDVAAWREALEGLERAWFAPALASLKRGSVEALRVSALGDEGQADFTIGKADLWKLWRRPMSAEQLAATESR